MGWAPSKAIMQLLHQTSRSRMARLNPASVTGSTASLPVPARAAACGSQQALSASTRRTMSSVRQKRRRSGTPAISPRAPTTSPSAARPR